MATDANQRRAESADNAPDETPIPTALAAEAEMPAEAEEEVPPALSGKSFLRRHVVRWAVMGVLRLVYRRWTRIAVILFPEDSRRAAWATHVGIPLPDRLNLSWITEHLAVGGRVLPTDIPLLARRGVTRVVDTRSEHQDDPAAMAKEHIELLLLPAPDTYPLTVEQLERGARWVNEQVAEGQRVLIHCEHGVGRSVLLTAAALVAGGMSASDAITLIQRKRWQAAPNHRQIQRLQEFERVIRAEDQTKRSA